MADNALTVVTIERSLNMLAPKFAQVLANTGVPVERVIRTVLVSIERNPNLLNCSQQSIMNAAMSAACLGLEVDGVTGQAFLIPFKDKCQLVIGYKGMNTMAARSGYTINGGLVREGDQFEYKLGSNAFIDHRPLLGNKGKIIAAWAIASAPNRSDIVQAPMSIDELMAVKAKSPGARKSDSPWNDETVGFPAMCEKTVKRRLARAMPQNIMQLGAAMDSAFEEGGRSSYIHPDKGLVIDGEAQVLGGVDRSEPNLVKPRYAIVLSDGGERTFTTPELYLGAVRTMLSKMGNAGDIEAFRQRQATPLGQLHPLDADTAMATVTLTKERETEIAKGAGA